MYINSFNVPETKSLKVFQWKKVRVCNIAFPKSVYLAVESKLKQTRYENIKSCIRRENI